MNEQEKERHIARIKAALRGKFINIRAGGGPTETDVDVRVIAISTVRGEKTTFNVLLEAPAFQQTWNGAASRRSLTFGVGESDLGDFLANGTISGNNVPFQITILD